METIPEHIEENLNLLDKEVIIANDVIPECSLIEEDNNKDIMSESIAEEIKNDIDNVEENTIPPEKISEKDSKRESTIFPITYHFYSSSIFESKI